MDSDDRLIEALQALDAPRIDVRFRAALMERIARRRLTIETGAGLAGLALASLLLFLSGQELSAVLNAAFGPLNETAPMLAGLAVAAWLGHRLATRGLPRFTIAGGRK